MTSTMLSRALRGNLRALAAAGYRGTVLALDHESHLVAVLDVQVERDRYLAAIHSGEVDAGSGLLTLPAVRFGTATPKPEEALRAAIDAARAVGLEIDIAPVTVTIQ